MAEIRKVKSRQPIAQKLAISIERIWNGDPPVPANGYCPLPIDIWPGLDRGKYYTALNNIVGGILCRSAAAHIDGLMQLFEFGQEYCEFVEAKYAPNTAKNIYYQMRSGTGNFEYCEFWIHSTVPSEAPGLLLRSSAPMLVICAPKEIIDLESSGTKPSPWRAPFSIPNESDEQIVRPRLEDLSRELLTQLIKGPNAIACVAIDQVLSSYEVEMADFWKVKDAAARYDRENTPRTSKIAASSKPPQYWSRNLDLLRKLYDEWTKRDRKLVDCSFDIFGQWMTTLKYPKRTDRIRWLGTGSELALWIKALDEANFLSSPRWEKVVSTFANSDGADFNISSLKSTSSTDRKNKAVDSPYRRTLELLMSWS